MTAPAKAAPMREDVTQADRDAAVEILSAMWFHEHGNVTYGWMRDEESATLTGKRDTYWAVKACARARHRLAHTARPDAVSCAAAPDHADILETIENAADDWQANGYTSALAEVRDMANVGRSLMEALPKGYCYMDSPAEIVTDLQNQLDEATARPDAGDEDVERVALPDIGPDPMKGDRSNRVEQATARVREAYVKQQAGVPDQTALVWRWDIGAILTENTRLTALAAMREGVDRGMVDAATAQFPEGTMYRSGHDGTGSDPSLFFCEAVSDAPECRRVRVIAATEAEARLQAAAALAPAAIASGREGAE